MGNERVCPSESSLMKRGEFAAVELQFAWVVGWEFADAKW